MRAAVPGASHAHNVSDGTDRSTAQRAGYPSTMDAVSSPAPSQPALRVRAPGCCPLRRYPRDPRDPRSVQNVRPFRRKGGPDTQWPGRNRARDSRSSRLADPAGPNSVTSGTPVATVCRGLSKRLNSARAQKGRVHRRSIPAARSATSTTRKPSRVRSSPSAHGGNFHTYASRTSSGVRAVRISPGPRPARSGRPRDRSRSRTLHQREESPATTRRFSHRLSLKPTPHRDREVVESLRVCISPPLAPAQRIVLARLGRIRPSPRRDDFSIVAPWPTKLASIEVMRDHRAGDSVRSLAQLRSSRTGPQSERTLFETVGRPAFRRAPSRTPRRNALARTPPRRSLDTCARDEV